MVISREIGIDEGGSVDLSVPLESLGVDSILLLEIALMLEDITGVSITDQQLTDIQKGQDFVDLIKSG